MSPVLNPRVRDLIDFLVDAAVERVRRRRAHGRDQHDAAGHPNRPTETSDP